jgi:hypothetical protein
MSGETRKNIYTCPKGHHTVTVDVDDGVTPFMLRCRQKDDDGKHNCTEMARSHMYRLTPIEQAMEPEYEWFKPLSLKGLSREMKEHVKKGGLELRKINPH